MLALSDMLHLFPNEFTSLRGGSLALPGILSGSLKGFLFRH
jgi:hypothetical protein